MALNKINKQQNWVVLRVAILLALTGLICILVFLWYGFSAWTLGIGVFLGFPLLGFALVLYLLAVLRDLRQHGLFPRAPR